MNEFGLIKQYFAQQNVSRSDVIQGIGDDAAILSVSPHHQLVMTTDILTAGVHFFRTASPYDIGYKSLAVNLSDLAAMGANPTWFTLSLTLEDTNEHWLQSFCEGLFDLSKQHHIQLVGGDLSHGPLSIVITACGLVPAHKALLRSHAKVGDLIYVTGTLGDAGFALGGLNHQYSLSEVEFASVLPRLHRPTPRLAVGQALLGLAHSAIDISDGLAADLGHILSMSQVGASVEVDSLPLSSTLQAIDRKEALHLALTAGDDYELCFTIPKEKRAELENMMTSLSCPLTCIGEIMQKLGLDLHYQNGKPYDDRTQGYSHF